MSTSTPQVIVYGLSTCIHCRHVKDFLESHNIQYLFVPVDQLEESDKYDALQTVKAANPRLSFPTILIASEEGTRVIIGFKPDELAEALHIND